MLFRKTRQYVDHISLTQENISFFVWIKMENEVMIEMPDFN